MNAPVAPPPGRTAYRYLVALLTTLQDQGVPATGLKRLLRLRLAWQHHDPALDGFVPDARTCFVQWLYRTGRLSDQAPPATRTR